MISAAIFCWFEFQFHFSLQLDFVKKHEQDIKKFAFFRNYDDSKNFLQEHMDLVCEETANYMVLMCLNLQMEGVITQTGSFLIRIE
jgi:hypothetical protein